MTLVQGRGMITQGCKTSTGGTVLNGISNVPFMSNPVTTINMQATCPKCKKGIGNIVPIATVSVMVDNVQVALHGDVVACGCPFGSNTVISNVGLVKSQKTNSGQAYSAIANSVDSSVKQTTPATLADPYASEIPFYSQAQNVGKRLSDSLALECSLEDELAKSHQQVLIADLEDAHKILHNIWLEMGRDTAAIAANINSAKSWFNNTQPMFDSASIAKQFGDLGVKADLVESKGKTFIAFSGIDKNGKNLKHAFVNGTRINMNGKKYPLNSFKSMQAGFSPRARASNFKGAALLTFFVSASIATSDLVFNDDYHLVDWFGNVGADMFKALLQYGAGEAMLLLVATMSGSILLGAALCVAAYVTIEFLWGEYGISKKIVTELENAVEN